MSKYLSDIDRRQALAWYAVLGFDLQTIADHYGLTVDQIREELDTERHNRDTAGKSTEPVPVKPHLMEREPTHADALMDCIAALKSILRTCNNDKVTANGIRQICKQISSDTLLKAGFIQ